MTRSPTGIAKVVKDSHAERPKAGRARGVYRRARPIRSPRERRSSALMLAVSCWAIAAPIASARAGNRRAVTKPCPASGTGRRRLPFDRLTCAGCFPCVRGAIQGRGRLAAGPFNRGADRVHELMRALVGEAHLGVHVVAFLVDLERALVEVGRERAGPAVAGRGQIVKDQGGGMGSDRNESTPCCCEEAALKSHTNKGK